ncbi:DUF983 domain-containing protein [Kordiimonas marina]|uniref:DUF983 domain-containing protein n=1 Tax=Kordiimonas marina TaxID=2872312 RepID=UPI001FF596CD|nr:DUF983 domain-containing protein [Kordiimonas marina]MCJ9427639.1 DUF983 domain-containing protein [Kordiimonas marina]
MTGTPDHKNADTGREHTSRSVSPYKAGLTCTCPNCGEGALFTNILEVKDRCDVCGFDLSAADPGDGAQVFVILVMGALCAIIGVILYGPVGLPPAVVAGVLFAMVVFGSLWMLRVFKALLIALQFHHDAREGRQEDIAHEKKEGDDT